jgi:hypothetical protein
LTDGAVAARIFNMEALIDEQRLKELLKAAVAEAFEERRELISDAVWEAMEDLALVRAIQEGQASAQISREEVFRVLDNET